MIIAVKNNHYFLNFNQLVFVVVKCCVLFEVRTGFLNIIKTSVGFNGLIIS